MTLELARSAAKLSAGRQAGEVRQACPQSRSEARRHQEGGLRRTSCATAPISTKGSSPREDGLIVYKRKRVACVKQAFRRIGRDLELPGFSQYGFRHFMNNQVRQLFRIPREYRSLWLGHVVKEGSITTSHYEEESPHVIDDVALATDCVIALLNEHTRRDLFAVDVLLNRGELEKIGARVMPQELESSRDSGGRDRDRTCDPYHVKVVLFR
jgi:hypothetical protein